MGLPPPISPADADRVYAAAQRVVEVHQRLSKWLRPGVTLPQVDLWVAKTLEELKCRSCFLGYQIPKSPKFPSHACLSVNHCVVHGTAASHLAPLGQGDILKVDIGVRYQGWVGDAAWTYAFGAPTPEVKRLMACGKESLRRGVLELKPGNTFGAWARTVQGHVESECGFHLIRGFGGHGYGRELHAAPFVSNTVPTHPGEWSDVHTACRPGTLVAVEPMIAAGAPETRTKGHEWPVYMKDGSMSVHYEHDVLITEKGPRVLTEGLELVNDIVA